MKNLIKSLILILLMLILSVVLVMRIRQPEAEPMPLNGSKLESVAPESVAPSAPVQPVSSAEPAPTPSPVPTPTPTPEPEPEFFTISVIGDETLTTHQNLSDESEYSYAGRMKGDYSYPFKNTAQYFKNDEFTITNLECTLSDTQMYSAQTFYFRAPSANAQILTEGGVDFVTTANNHALDFGQAGLLQTYASLEQYGVLYGTENQAQVITTDHGLKIGVYCAYNDFQPNIEKAAAGIQQMKADGADYIICAFHWGQELYYQPNASQIQIGHACIDAGADLIFGCHSHCLQPIEEYNGGIILYSMGEFSFGGHTAPTDRDTAIFQVSLKRDLDGTVSVDSWNVIPCCVSSRPVYEGYTWDNYNDFCPTPYEVGSEDYLRVISKLTGTYEASSQGVDYSNWYASYG
ncbi:MAG: CapA family protein [Oscillospiraceae bacterium]|nr:CapA family protein [Oscillospiraceae bacterium]